MVWLVAPRHPGIPRSPRSRPFRETKGAECVLTVMVWGWAPLPWLGSVWVAWGHVTTYVVNRSSEGGDCLHCELCDLNDGWQQV